MRALFSYNPDEDEDHPCKEAGLQFSNGDVLKVVNRDDAQWWQASLAGNKKGRVGLVPSAKLREKWVKQLKYKTEM